MSLPGNIGLLSRLPSASSIGYGNVDGPASSTDKALAIFNGTTGKLIQNSAITLTGTALLGIGATDVSITAGGANQNITLTPSGTGQVGVGSAAGSNPQLVLSTDTDTGFVWFGANQLGLNAGGVRYLSLGHTGPNNTTINGTGLFELGGTARASLNVSADTTAGNLQISSPTTGAITFRLGGTEKARFAPTTGNLLLGGLTTDGVGYLQMLATSTATGISLRASDGYIYSPAAATIAFGGNSTALQVASSGGTLQTFARSAGASGIDLGEIAGTSGATRIYSAQTLALTLDSSQNATFAGAIKESTDTRSGPGAVSVTKTTTKVTSTGVLDALTLADGTDGQVKRVVHDVDGGSFVLTPTTKTGFSTFTSTVVGETISLQFVTTRGWMVLGSFGGVIA